MSAQDIDLSVLQANLKEIYQDFQTLKPYAEYKPKLVPKAIKKTVLTVTDDNETEGKNKQTKVNNGKISCDLVIVLDCTGSMASWISKCKEYILTVIDDVKQEFRQSEMRVAFVAYRDIADNPNTETFNFIEKDYQRIKTFISKLDASGGADMPEDLAGGLNIANNFDWRSNHKCLFIITDAPCHGTKFHTYQDDYPKGDPNGIDIENVILQMGKKGIDISVVDINNYTDLMYSVLNKSYKSARGKDIAHLKIGDGVSSNASVASKDKKVVVKNDFSSSLSKSIISSITGSSLNPKNTLNKVKENISTDDEDKLCLKALRILQSNKGLLNTQCLSVTELEFDGKDNGTKKFQTKYATKAGEIEEEDESGSDRDEDEEEEKSELSGLSKREQQQITQNKYLPTQMEEQIDWYENMKSNEVFTLNCTCFTPYVDKSTVVDWRKPSIKFNKLSSKIKVYKKYFSEGAMRQAFYAHDTVLNQKLVAKLHKNMKDNSNFELMKRDCMSLIACHYFADEFNSRILITTKNFDECPNLLNFVDSAVYEVQKHFNNHIRYYFVENYIDGEYSKYNNNAGWTNDSGESDFNQISQAFSHFTWQYSQGQLLVVDIQGGQLGILTDPQIHTKNKSKLYGIGDLGYEGMLKFFYTHHCNSYCQQLGLIHPILQKEFPKNFNFFSDLFGLESIEENQAKQMKELTEKQQQETIEEEKKEIEMEVKNEEILTELPPKKEDYDAQKDNQKKQKKKRGQALKDQYEKERIQRELEEKQQEEEQKLRLEEEKKKKEMELQKAQKKKEGEEQEKKRQELLKAKLNPQVITQCYFCKKCFQVDLKKVVQNKISKKETFCSECEYQCNSSLIDIQCSGCGVQFQLSKYYYKMKKQNMVGQCSSCKE